MDLKWKYLCRFFFLLLCSYFTTVLFIYCVQWFFSCIALLFHYCAIHLVCAMFYFFYYALISLVCYSFTVCNVLFLATSFEINKHMFSRKFLTYTFLQLLLNLPCFGLCSAKCYKNSVFLNIMRIFALTNPLLSLNTGTSSDTVLATALNKLKKIIFIAPKCYWSCDQ